MYKIWDDVKNHIQHECKQIVQYLWKVNCNFFIYIGFRFSFPFSIRFTYLQTRVYIHTRFFNKYMLNYLCTSASVLSLCMHFKSMKRKLGCLCLLLCPKITFARSEARIALNILYKQIILFRFADLNLPHSHCRNPTRGDTYKWAQYDTKSCK